MLGAFIELAARLGYQVWLAPINANGKPLHVQGFINAFEKAAKRNAQQLHALSQFDIPLVGIDPAMTLTYRQEYTKVPGIGPVPTVALPQEWLHDVLPEKTAPKKATVHRLLPH